ncbi:MAG: SMI1/KNR4 family protein [Pseudomonadota bacterium]
MLPVIRIITGLALLGGVIAFGVMLRSPWVIVPLTLIFTVCFGLGRWRAWREAASNGALGRAMAGQAGTLLVQGILVSILYILGRGIAAMTWGGDVTRYEPLDTRLLLAFAVVAIGLGVTTAALEARVPAHHHLMPKAQSAEGDAVPASDSQFELVFEDGPITEETFWNVHHYRHYTNTPDTERTLDPSRAFLSDEQISGEEARLNIKLPARLRRLYALQNGGSLMDLWVPARDLDAPGVSNGWAAVFSGYNDLTPLTDLSPLKEHIEAYAYFEDEPHQFPKGADRMIPLARWYDETLFLDYRDRDEPRVGFGEIVGDDLRTGDWEANALWWDSFDAFFAELRRGDLE